MQDKQTHPFLTESSHLVGWGREGCNCGAWNIQNHSPRNCRASICKYHSPLVSISPLVFPASLCIFCFKSFFNIAKGFDLFPGFNLPLNLPTFLFPTSYGLQPCSLGLSFSPPPFPLGIMRLSGFCRSCSL